VLPASVFAVAIALSGCSSDAPPDEAITSPTPRLIQGAAPGEDNETLTEMPDIAEPTVTDGDVEFVQMMLTHHAQALEMTALVPTRSAREDVPLFAERIELSQAGEIELMVSWLQDRDLPVPQGFDETSDEGHADHDSHTASAEHEHHAMPGLLSPEQMEQLADAEGEEFDRLFLQFMHYHHNGALTMVQDLWDRGGGQEPELSLLANHIDSDQRIEMDRMESMLAELGATP